MGESDGCFLAIFLPEAVDDKSDFFQVGNGCIRASKASVYHVSSLSGPLISCKTLQDRLTQTWTLVEPCSTEHAQSMKCSK